MRDNWKVLYGRDGKPIGTYWSRKPVTDEQRAHCTRFLARVVAGRSAEESKIEEAKTQKTVDALKAPARPGPKQTGFNF